MTILGSKIKLALITADIYREAEICAKFLLGGGRDYNIVNIFRIPKVSLNKLSNMFLILV